MEWNGNLKKLSQKDGKDFEIKNIFAFQIMLRKRQLDGNHTVSILIDFFVPKFPCYNQLKPGRSKLMLKLSIIEIITLFFITPVARSIFRPLAQTHISELEFKNGHISRFRFVFQIIQVISSAKFFSAEEVDLSFNSKTKEHPQISKPSFWKRDHENVYLQMF